MPAVPNSERLVRIELDQGDLDSINNGEAVTVECPHTGGTIAFGQPAEECECCGQVIDVEPVASPNISGLVDRLEGGGTAIYTTTHEQEDITVVVRAARRAVDGNGWV